MSTSHKCHLHKRHFAQMSLNQIYDRKLRFNLKRKLRPRS